MGAFPKKVAGLRLTNFNGYVLSFGKFVCLLMSFIIVVILLSFKVEMRGGNLGTNFSMTFSSSTSRNRVGKTAPWASSR